MKTFFFIVLSSLAISSAHADQIADWERNYQKMVTIFQGNPSVGDCSVSLSGAPEAGPNSYFVNILRNPGGLTTFDIDPPTQTGGRTRVDFLSSVSLRYSQSDFVGWVNLDIALATDGKTIVGLKLNKTLPDGTEYQSGVVCGQIR